MESMPRETLSVAEPNRVPERRRGLLTQTKSARQGVAGVELVQPPQDKHPEVDRSRSSGLPLFMEESNEVKEVSLGQLLKSQPLLLEPTASAPEREGVGSKGGG
jgi:hypothetical protein